nr:PREDICTED: 2-oxoisovalerate dehydrogenase subunit alpha, mitochondrial [Bemisia tabaci]
MHSKLILRNLRAVGTAVRCFQSSCASSSAQLNLETQNDSRNSSAPVFPVDFTSKLQVTTERDVPKIPIYQVLGSDGRLIDSDQRIDVDEETTVKMYEAMMRQNILDGILYQAQRQGRISFYMTSFGEEGVAVGSASALESTDLVYGQYREAGVLMWRGFTLSDFINQCYSNDEDLGRGRQMPIHYGSRKLNFITLSSPLATQVPQAVGSAYAFKLAKNGRCVIAYFGEGAASEGDTHAAFNFAATLQCPVILFCRNNGYAISTPSREQYRGDAIAGRAVGYGLAAVRVDGNDIFAVRNATKYARDYCMSNNIGVVIEAMTYRVGHHSTSDDSSAYRSKEEVEDWDKSYNPITRLRLFMEHSNWWNEEKEKLLAKQIKADVLKAVAEAEKKLKPEISELFTDVYYEMPDHLMEQSAYLADHLKKYGEHYPLDNYKK